MARDDQDAWKRFREREDEQENEKTNQKVLEVKFPSLGKSNKVEVSSDRFDEFLSRADPLIEQINNLYNMYIAGVEKTPPLQKRKILDQVMASLQGMSKPTPSARFKFNSMQSRYLVHKDRWDKLIRDLESGKIKRKLGIHK
jgi:hypothetical protein